MAASASDWNAKYLAAAEEASAEPGEFVRELLPRLPLGPALDLACGTGRHTLLLASRQQPVTAVDSSDVALEMLEKRARASHYVVSRIERAAQVGHRQHGIQLWHTNLEEVNLPRQAFSLVVCGHYLQRSLFEQNELALVPGGVLLFESYTVAQHLIT